MNQLQNEMYIRLPAQSRNEAVARSVLAVFCAAANPTVEELGDLRCALSEAVTNCIVHAYRDVENPAECYIHLTFRLTVDRIVEVEIRDEGCGIADVEEARRPHFTTGSGEERCGMGFLVMESFTDGMTVVSEPDIGTTVCFDKKLKSLPNGEE